MSGKVNHERAPVKERDRYPVTPGERQLIQIAAALAGEKPGTFVTAAAVERARVIVAERAPELVEALPAA